MQPMLATPAPSGAELPRGPEWVYEIKWDGVRVLADTTDGRLRLRARSGRDVTVTYPELARIADVKGAVLDGEVVVTAGGTPTFEALAERMNVSDAAVAQRLSRRLPATFVVFDLLVLSVVDLRRRPLSERRESSPLAEDVPTTDAIDVVWCEPRVLVDVAYLQRTRGGRLRQPVVRGPRTETSIDPWEQP